MSLSPSPVEQVNDVVIIHLSWSLIGLKEPHMQLWVIEVKKMQIKSFGFAAVEQKFMRLILEKPVLHHVLVQYFGICFAYLEVPWVFCHTLMNAL